MPKLPEGEFLKLGTFRINADKTNLGERSVKVILDEMCKGDFK